VIVLVGFMGAGKTTVGNLLAARLELPFADSDQVIEHRAGRPVSQIFAEDGEPAFRALEHQVIAELLDGPEMVLALGGGSAEHPRTRDRLSEAQVVYLQVGYAQALRRVAGDNGRPLLARPDLAALYERRLAVYARVATLTVPTDDRHPETVSEDVLAQLVREPASGGSAPHRPFAP
jgi:shikimate kinase